MTHATIRYVWDVAITRWPVAIAAEGIFEMLSPHDELCDWHNW